MPGASTDAPAGSVTMDASVAIPWIVQEQSTPAIDALFQDGYRGALQLRIPALWWWECGNVLLELVKRRRLTEAQAEEGFRTLRYANPAAEPAQDVASQHRTLVLARAHKLSYYDASYLELARRTGSLLATLDRDLRRAASAAGVSCLAL